MAKRGSERYAKKQRITLDTDVPVMPSQLLELPTEADLERKIDEIDERIQVLKDSIED